MNHFQSLSCSFNSKLRLKITDQLVSNYSPLLQCCALIAPVAQNTLNCTETWYNCACLTVRAPLLSPLVRAWLGGAGHAGTKRFGGTERKAHLPRPVLRRCEGSFTLDRDRAKTKLNERAEATRRIPEVKPVWIIFQHAESNRSANEQQVELEPLFFF